MPEIEQAFEELMKRIQDTVKVLRSIVLEELNDRRGAGAISYGVRPLLFEACWELEERRKERGSG
jgi:hypothetical protein